MPRVTSPTMDFSDAAIKRFTGRSGSALGESTPQIQVSWRICPHDSMAGCCPMGRSIRNSAHIRSFQTMVVVVHGAEPHERIEIGFLARRFGLIECCHQLLDDRLIGIRSHFRCKFHGCGDGSRRTALNQDRVPARITMILSTPRHFMVAA
jgi:hypothetical protein